MTRLTMLALAAALAAAPALASTVKKTATAAEAQDCPLGYAVFEFATPHVDLETCPAAMNLGEGVFCRAAVGSDMLHVYAFEEAGFQCLKAMRSFETPEFEIRLR